jgi:hypothetical protein
MIKMAQANPGVVVFMPANTAVDQGLTGYWWAAPPRNPSVPRSTWDRVLALDGVHFCAAGTELYAAAIAHDVALVTGRPPATENWWLSGWQNVKVKYGETIIAYCPSDHPT